MARKSNMGRRVRSLRRQNTLTQVQLADRLGISPSYLNLIEHNRRAMPAAPLLIKIAEIFDLDLKALSTEPEDARTVRADLMEVFGDPIFENEDVTTSPEVRRPGLPRAHRLARGPEALSRVPRAPGRRPTTSGPSRSRGAGT